MKSSTNLIILLLSLVGKSIAQPTIASYSPADNATISAGVLTYTVTFDSDINYVGTDGSIYLRQTGASILYEVTADDISTSGNTATIFINKPVPDGSISLEYELFITASAFESIAGPAFPGNLADRPKVTVSYTNPTVASLFPDDDATDVWFTEPLTITFNESIRPSQFAGSGIYDVRIRSSVDGVDQRYFFSDPEVTVTSNSITIDPSESYRSGDQLFVQFTNGVIELDDSTPGLFFNDIQNSSSWNFSVLVDDTPPILQNSSPADEGDFAYLEGSFYINFNEDIKLGTGSVSLFLADGTPIESIPVSPTNTDPRVYIHPNNRAFYYNFDAILEEVTDYYVTMTPGTVLDIHDNSFAGLTAGDLNFTSNPRPKLDLQVPANQSTNVNLTPTFEFGFDAYMTVETGTVISLREYQTDNLVESFDLYTDRGSGFDGEITDTQTVSLSPTDPLMEATKYYLSVEPTNSIFDLEAFSQLDGKEGWSFTTGDFTTPSVVTRNPHDGAQNVPIDQVFTIEFDEELLPPTATLTNFIKIRNNIGSPSINIAYTTGSVDDGWLTVSGNTISFSRGTLFYDTDYYITIGDNTLADLAGNTITGLEDNTIWTFRTEPEPDTSAPVATSTSPSDEGTFAPLSATGGIVFNEGVQEAPGSIELYLADGTLVESIPTGNNDTRLGQPADFRITWDFDTDLIPATNYYILVSEGAYEDLAGNAFAGISIGELDFTSNARPEIEALTPADGSTEVASNASIMLDLDVSVYTDGQVNLVIKQYATESPVESFDLSGTDVGFGAGSFPDGIINLQPTNTFASETEYYVVLEGTGSLLSEVNIEAFNGLSEKDDWTFTSEVLDNSAPTIEFFDPADDAVNVPTNVSSFSLNFNESVRLAADPGIAGTDYYLELRNLSNGNTVVKSFDLNSSEATFSGNSITLTNELNLPDNSDLYIRYYLPGNGTNPIEDLSGNQLASFNNNTSWNFTTGDNSEAPVIASRSPANNAIEVNMNTDLILTFNENVQLSGSGTLKLFNRSTGMQEGPNWFFPTYASVEGPVVTIDLPNALKAGTEYFVELTAGIEDLDGNTAPDIAGPNTWYFTTEGEAQAPMIISQFPANGATEVDVNADLVLTFDEEVQSTASGTLKIYERTTGNQVGQNWFFPSAATFNGTEVAVDIPITLDPETEYYVEIADAVQDVWGNVLQDIAGESDWNFTTGPIDGPEILSLSPADNATDVELTQTFTVTFDEPVQFTQLGLIRIKNDDGSTHTNIPFDQGSVDNGWVTVEGNSVTFFREAYEYSSTYYITFDDGVFEDLDGNPLTGYSDDPDFWNFTTIAEDGPELVSVTPDFGSTIEPQAKVLIMTFDEPVQYGRLSTPQFRIYTSDGSDYINTNFTEASGRVSFNQNVVTVTFSGPNWNPGDYYVTLSPQAIEDLDGIQYEGFLDPTFWTFSVSDPSKEDQNITFPEVPDVAYGEAVTLSASASSTLNVSYEILDGSELVSRDGNNLTASGIGTVTVQASQEGNESFNPATPVNRSFTISKASQTISFQEPPTATFGDSNLTLSATGGISGNEVVFESLDETIATVSGNQVTILEAGTVEISATQAGNEFYEPAVPVVQTLVVNKADQVITIDPIANKLTTDASFEVIASVDSELPLEYSVDGPATNSGSTLTLTGAEGTVTVNVTQAGNDNYLATFESVSFEVTEEEAVLNVGKTSIDISYYPNPVSDRIHIEADQLSTIRLIHLDGRVLIEKEMKQGAIDLTSLNRGVYLLEVKAENQTLRKQIIKN